MTVLSLDYLPFETLSAIRNYLEHSHPPSVLSFALANKRCYAVASAFWYRNITFGVGPSELLAQDAQRCEDLLRRDSAFQHVRRVIVYGQPGGLLGRVYFPGDEGASTDQPSTWERLRPAKLIKWPYRHEGRLIDRLGLLSDWPPGRSDTVPAQVCQSDKDWRPPCRLVELLPALTDFFFICRSTQFPPCLLCTLHQHFSPPRLKLHVDFFHLPNKHALPYVNHLPAIIKRCPLLEILSVSIPRVQGRAAEVAVYRLVGSLPRLRCLNLTLVVGPVTLEVRRLQDAAPSQLQETEEDELDTLAIFPTRRLGRYAIKKRILRDALVDSAVDERLAITIFNAVSSGKQQPHTSSTTIPSVPLEQLTLRTTIHCCESISMRESVVRNGLNPYIGHMARSWRVERNPRDDRPGVLRAAKTEQDERARLAALGPPMGPKGIVVLPVFRGIWPAKAEGSRWQDDWESLPLEGVDEEE
ncbi:hypothetical protein N0V88_005027 [Collariella sp. IMI 366227]|nr:hypothetical protein N0V88_005027 [Collariella sp. IMI 366227]